MNNKDVELNKLKKQLEKSGSILSKIIKNRPKLIRQYGIKNNIQDFGNGDGLTKAFFMNWWEMVELQKNILENKDDFRKQLLFKSHKEHLLLTKKISINKFYSEIQKQKLKNWALNYILKLNLDDCL